MAALMLLSSCLMYSLMCLTISAPSHINIQDEATVIPVTSVQEVGTVDNSSSVTISNSNGSKTSSSGSSDVANKAISGTMNIVEKGDQSDVNTKIDAVNVPVVMDAGKTDPKSNVMTLTDDVITDALFTNIDTLQDHLEVCEEGLRQQLRLHSHGQLLQDTAGDDGDYQTDMGGTEQYRPDSSESSDSKKNRQANTVDEGYEDNDSDDNDSDTKNGNDDSDIEDDDDSRSPEMASDSSSKIKRRNDRQRRSVAGANRGGQLSRKADILAQKVVQRLSARLEYLRSSLFQCHLLYKQLGLL